MRRFRMSFSIVIGLLSAALGQGCDRSTAGTSTPKAAAKAFAAAMVAGDAAAIRATSVGDDATAKYLAALADFNAASDRVVAASRAKFGDGKSVLSLQRAGDHYAEVLAGIDQQPEVITGEAATVGTGWSKIYLKKTPDGWRVDRSLQVPTGDWAGVLDDWAARTKIYRAVAGGIENGTFATPEAAKTAVWVETTKLIMERTPPKTLPAMSQPTPSPVDRP